MDPSGESTVRDGSMLDPHGPADLTGRVRSGLRACIVDAKNTIFKIFYAPKNVISSDISSRNLVPRADTCLILW